MHDTERLQEFLLFSHNPPTSTEPMAVVLYRNGLLQPTPPTSYTHSQATSYSRQHTCYTSTPAQYPSQLNYSHSTCNSPHKPPLSMSTQSEIFHHQWVMHPLHPLIHSPVLTPRPWFDMGTTFLYDPTGLPRPRPAASAAFAAWEEMMVDPWRLRFIPCIFLGSRLGILTGSKALPKVLGRPRWIWNGRPYELVWYSWYMLTAERVKCITFHLYPS